MVKKPAKVNANATILEAVDIILEHKVSGLCVVDDNDKLVGVLSELDCLRAIVDRIYVNKQSSAGYVYEVMTKDVETNKAGDDIISVASSMLQNKRRRRPVVNGSDLVGQITCRQILGAIQDFTIPSR
ncbi:MAG: CBS domain-containing protein [Pseudomonadales bacterium]|nr:CBS domain-containing protein [Pseudomonadales bacterium]